MEKFPNIVYDEHIVYRREDSNCGFGSCAFPIKQLIHHGSAVCYYNLIIFLNNENLLRERT